jgi:tetratricopeptide (TPR) repeat protein
MPLAAALLLVVMTPQDAPQASPQAVASTEIAQAGGPAAAAIAAGQTAFRKRRFRAAQAAFEKAVAADPQSAAAAFYLGYTHYKLGEPSRRLNANKEQARDLFAKAYTLDPAFRPDWRRPAPAPPK